MSFSRDIKKFRAKALKGAEMVVRGTALDLFAGINLRTPVDTGRLRANWQLNINSIPAGTINDTDKRGAKARRKAEQGVKAYDAGDVIYIVNNLPYAPVIERGSSAKAPRGMVGVTITEFKRHVERRAREQR